MLLVVVILFWSGLLFVLYTYAGYPLLMLFLTRNKKKTYKSIDYTIEPELLPSITLIVAAYNEEKILPQKIANSLALDYCQKKLHLLFITDGSTDGSNQLISQHPSIQLLYEPLRKGKTAAINRAVQHAHTDIIVLTDANAMLNTNCLYNIARHFHDSRVGGVAGEKKVIGKNGTGSGEGAYWKYESVIKQMDSALYSVVGAAGELFAMRRSLYAPLEENIILDDFVQSLLLTQKGYVIRYEPDAYAIEQASLNLSDERERKTRISAGGFQAIGMLKPLLNIFRHKTLSFLYISHRVLRWTICPLSLPVIFFSALYLYIYTSNPLYQWALILQLFFYVTALIGYLTKWKLFYISFYFFFMNLCVYIGFFRFLRRKQSAVWEKVEREAED